jgi:predicted adenylyl cyclase CyaB
MGPIVAVEIEAKFRLSDRTAIRRRLARLGARPQGMVLEHNTYFDTPGGRLRRRDCGLRIRLIHRTGRAVRAWLTYKGPRRRGNLKIRPEEEVELSCPRAARAILEGLGLRAVASFQKRRWDYRLGRARVSLDELPELGFFLEIEADDAPAVRKAARRLGLAGEAPVTDTYLALVVRHLAARGRRKTAELAF